MSSFWDMAFQLLEWSEIARKQQSEQPAPRWPEERGVSWFRFFLIWWGVEALFRLFGPFAFRDTVFMGIGVDMACLFVAMPLAWLLTRQFAGAPLVPSVPPAWVGRARAAGEGVAFGLLALAVTFPLHLVDGWLFGAQPPPSIPRDGLTLAALLAVNGVWAPVFEELAWRGRLQRSLAAAHGFGWALVVTSTLFTFKHAFVDLSLGRLLTIFGIGLCLGVAARRGGLVSSITAHVVLNVTASALAWWG